jgi:hypothetical protein
MPMANDDADVISASIPELTLIGRDIAIPIQMLALASGFYESNVIKSCQPRGGYKRSNFAKFPIARAKNSERREVMPARGCSLSLCSCS